MEIRKTKYLTAGNIHARRSVMEVFLDAEPLPMLSPDQLTAFWRGLPGLREEVVDFPAFRRLNAAETDIPATALIEVLALIVQRHMNWPLRFCAWRPDDAKIGTSAIFEVGTRRIGLRAARIAVELLAAFLADPRADLAEPFRKRMRSLARKVARETPSLDALAIARAAAKRGITWASIPDSTYLRLGSGRHAHILHGSETTTTSSISREMARRKSVANTILAAAGLPVSRQKKARTLADAEKAAASLGYPLVIKPANGNMGKGVSVGIVDQGQIEAAFHRAQAISRDVLIETFIEGEEYRLLVIGGRFTAASRRVPAHVKGDGVTTVQGLVARENQRPIRESLLPGQMAARLPIMLDNEAIATLSEQGHSETTVPERGETVFLRRESNVSRGGEAIDVTDRVHPSIKAVAERTARVLGIDVCGVDFIARDIGKPWMETGAAICEVNTRPGLSLHTHVSDGQARDVASDVVQMLYPKGTRSRIPAIALLETEETSSLRREIETAAARAGRRLGIVAGTSGGNSVSSGTGRLPDVSSLAWDEDVEAAVVVVSAKDVVRRGLGLERIDLAILPRSGTSATMRAAGDALARAASRKVVIADDPNALDAALRALRLPRKQGKPDRLPAEPVRPAARGRSADSFTSLMVGDIGFGEFYMHHPRARALQRLLAEHGHIHSFSKLRGLLSSADYVIGNLEAPLAPAPDPALRGRKKYLCWSDAERAVDALRGAGFNAVSLANNHALDGGTAGLLDGLSRLQAAGIRAFGAGANIESAGRPMITRFQLGGVEHSLVVFGAFEHRTRYENRYRWYARGEMAGVNVLSAERIGAEIETLRGQLPRPIFVAYPHWGVDYTGVNDMQREMAGQLVRAGADLIVGHGTHTAQSVETIDGVPVVYGLGNFVWNTPGRYAASGAIPCGLAASLRFSDGPSGLGVRIRLHPILTDNRITAFRNRPLSDAEFEQLAPDLTKGWDRAPEAGMDDTGHYFEISAHLGTGTSAQAEPQKVSALNGHRPPPAAAASGDEARLGRVQ